MEYKEIDGDIIQLALEGRFEVIGHGVNCFCIMKAGIAPQMAKVFGCDKYTLEVEQYKGDINKLGQIQWQGFSLKDNIATATSRFKADLFVVNCYTQFMYGINHTDGISKPLDYEALTLCMRKINHIFKGKHIGLPKIGCGLAGGDWNGVKEIIKNELKDCKITIVNYKK